MIREGEKSRTHAPKWLGQFSIIARASGFSIQPTSVSKREAPDGAVKKIKKITNFLGHVIRQSAVMMVMLSLCELCAVETREREREVQQCEWRGVVSSHWVEIAA